MFGPAWRPTEAVRIVRFNGWRRVQRAASAPVETVQLPRVERGSLFHSIPCLPNLQALRLSQSSGGALGGSRCGGQKPGRLEVGQSEARLHDEDRRGGRMQNDHGRAGGGGGSQSMSLRRVQRGPKAQQAASELRKTALANGEDVIKTTGLKTAIQDCRSPKVRVGGGACRERRMVRNTSERSPGNPKLDPASALVPWAPDLWR